MVELERETSDACYDGSVIDAGVEERVQRLLAQGTPDEAAAAVIRGYGPRIIDYLRGVLRDEDLAGDAFSQFGERVWRGIAGFRGDASVLSWCYRLAWSALCRVVESGHQRKRSPLETTHAERLVAEVRTATRPYQQTQIKNAVAQLRAQLSRDEQTLLYLRVDQDLPWTEVADVMDVDAATLRKRFERIKDKLRDLARAAGLIRGE